MENPLCIETINIELNDLNIERIREENKVDQQRAEFQHGLEEVQFELLAEMKNEEALYFGRCF